MRWHFLINGTVFGIVLKRRIYAYCSWPWPTLSTLFCFSTSCIVSSIYIYRRDWRVVLTQWAMMKKHPWTLIHHPKSIILLRKSIWMTAIWNRTEEVRLIRFFAIIWKNNLFLFVRRFHLLRQLEEFPPILKDEFLMSSLFTSRIFCHGILPYAEVSLASYISINTRESCFVGYFITQLLRNSTGTV